MANKRRSIALTQESDNTFRVTSWSNSAELSVGLIVSRSKLNAWCALPGVQVTVRGLTPVAESDKQLDLFSKAEVKALKAVIASP